MAKRIKLPRRLKIGAHWYKVILAHKPERPDDEDFGVVSYRDGTIQVERGLMPTKQFSTLLHEIMHVCNSEIDHAMLDALSEQLTQVLLDNNMLR